MTAFGLGLMAVIWVAIGYIGSHFLALTMTLIIGAVYVFGALELQRFHRDTTALAAALRALPAGLVSLEAWLAGLPESLRNAVRLRVEGERVGLPGPAVTPYLVGLLVMLGMLGTFLGMVVTLNGAVLALEGSTDLATIRAALSAPVKGLGLAFGTSVAGVAASAMLGLVSALCRRERQDVGLLLDTQIAGALREFSLTHQRQETFKAMQQQAHALPGVVDKLEALMATLVQQNSATQAQLTAGQDAFHRATHTTFTTLADSVERSLRTALADSARAAVDTVKPAVETALEGFARTAGTQHERIAATVERQLDSLATRFDSGMTQTTARWAEALDARLANQAQQEETRLATWAGTLERSTQDSAAQIQTQARATLDEIARLIDTAAAAPQAAAEVIARLREEVSANLARDNALLAERQRMGADLQALLDRLQTSAAAQEAAVDTLVRASSARLEDAAAALAARLDAEAARMTEGATQITAGAAEVASLGEAFGHAVELFSQTGAALTANLQRIESALENAMARSDDQLAYYVAQAREIIDLSVMSQQRVVEDLRQLGRATPRAAEVC